MHILWKCVILEFMNGLSKFTLFITILATGFAIGLATSAHATRSNVIVLENPDRQINSSPMDAVAINRDATIFASGDRQGVVRLWNAASGDVRAVLPAHDAWVTQVIFSPDGDLIASASHDNTVALWNTHTFTPTRRLENHTRAVMDVAFSPNGDLIATGGLDGTVWIGRVSSGETVLRLPNDDNPVWSLAFSPGGDMLVAGGEDGSVRIWELRTGRIQKLTGHSGAVTDVQFTSDGRNLVTASWDRTLRRWNTSTLRLQRVYEGHSGPVTGVRFVGSGMQMISSGLDGALMLWDLADSHPLAIMNGDDSPVGSLAYDSVRGQVISTGTQGTLDMWEIAGRIGPLLSAPLDGDTWLIDDVRGQPVAPSEDDQQVTRRPLILDSTDSALSLPTVNIYAGTTTFPLEGVSWAIDPWEQAVGHFQGTAWGNQSGNIVLGGHSEMPNGAPGIFSGLYGLSIGDPIILTIDGEDRHYNVIEIRTVRYDDLSVVYPSDSPQLTLITCDIPSYDSATNTYDERLVVIALPAN